MTPRQITPLGLLVPSLIARLWAALTDLPKPGGAMANGREILRAGRSDRRRRRHGMALVAPGKRFAPVEPCREPKPALCGLPAERRAPPACRACLKLGQGAGRSLCWRPR